MEYDDEEFRLAPIDDEELGLASVEDEETAKPIAPDVPFNVGVRLIPVTCSACKTRMYAGEDQVGLWKRCPDCYRLTEIRAVPPRFMLIADDPEAAGGYGVQQPAISRQDIFQLKAKNQKDIDEHREKQDKIRAENRLPPPIFIDKPPMMEGVLNNILKSDEEKNEEIEMLRQKEKIDQEVEAIKKAVREGKLDAYLAKSQDPAERKRQEKQREFEAASPPPLKVYPPPPPLPPLPQSNPEVSMLNNPEVSLRYTSGSLIERNTPGSEKRSFSKNSLWAPLLDSRCRARMIVLTVCGFLGNFTGEKARSMIWQVLVDKVYGQSPGYSYNFMESGFLFVNFWFGAVLSIVWLTMLFLFGISLFLETAEGKDRVDNWVPFNLDFGLSYFGWTLLILFVSGFPGFIVWQGISFFLPDKESSLIFVHFIGQFLCFPILFLCVIESDTFYGDFPRKTLTSLYRQPILWLRLYVTATFLVGIPVMILGGLLVAGTAFGDYWIMQSFVYYFTAAILLTFSGYFVLLYFRLLGNVADVISEK